MEPIEAVLSIICAGGAGFRLASACVASWRGDQQTAQTHAVISIAFALLVIIGRL